MRSTNKIRIVLSFPMLSTSLCEETMPAKNTFRIPLLTELVKITLLKWHKEIAHSKYSEDLNTIFIGLGPWWPLDLHF